MTIPRLRLSRIQRMHSLQVILSNLNTCNRSLSDYESALVEGFVIMELVSMVAEMDGPTTTSRSLDTRDVLMEYHVRKRAAALLATLLERRGDTDTLSLERWNPTVHPILQDTFQKLGHLLKL